MGLRSDIQEDLAEAMDGDLADVVISFDFITVTYSAYDADTDSKTPIETDHVSRGIFDQVSDKLVDGINILAKDEMVIVNGPDLTAAFIALGGPKIDMEIKLSDDTRYKIVDPGAVMGGNSTVIIHEMIVRKTGDGVQ